MFFADEKDSANFKVRIVYFNAAETANDLEVNSRLGISQDFTDPLLSAPFIKITRECFVFFLMTLLRSGDDELAIGF